MRIPIGETEVGYFWVGLYDKSRAHFVVDDGSWSSDYAKKHNYRRGTYAEFKILYPYDNGNGKSRSKIKTRYNSIYNKNI